MVSKGWALLSILVMAGLAGCTGSTGGQDTSSSSSSTAALALSTSNSTTTLTPPGHPPVITAFTANLTGLNASFSFTATDPDNDTLSYALSFGDNSTNLTGSLPRAAVNHTFASIGNYTARLTVRDGSNSTNRSLALAVHAAVAGAKPDEVFSCTVDAPAVVVSVQGLPIAFGYCTFTTTDGPTVLAVAAPASGCTIRLDEDTSDTSAGPTVEESSTNPPGEYGMRCDVQGPSVGGDGSITIRAL